MRLKEVKIMEDDKPENNMENLSNEGEQRSIIESVIS